MKQKKMYMLETISFSLPAILLVCLIMYVPFFLSGFYSLTSWNGISKNVSFVGFENFKTIFLKDKDFIHSLWFTIRYTFVFTIFSNLFALIVAICLTKKFHGANVLRSVFFIPYIISMTVVGFIWKFIFTSGFSKLFEITKLPFFNYSWLGDVNLVFVAVCFVGVWQSLGFYIVLYVAGLQSVPKELIEASTVDGATVFQRFFKIIVFQLGPSFTTCIFMSLTNGFKVFDIILALTKGGPGTATNSITLQIYKEAFTNNNYGIGSAESIIFFVFVLVITQLVLKQFRKAEVN